MVQFSPQLGQGHLSLIRWIMTVFYVQMHGVVTLCTSMFHPLVHCTPTHRKKEVYFYKFESKEKLWWAGESLPCVWEQDKKLKDAGNLHCFLPAVSRAVDRSSLRAVSLPLVTAKPKQSHEGQIAGEFRSLWDHDTVLHLGLQGTNTFFLAWSVWLSGVCLYGACTRHCLTWEWLVSRREQF